MVDDPLRGARHGGGSSNGFLITKINVNPLVATLGTGQIVRGLALVYSQGGTYNINGGFFDMLGSGYVGAVPVPLIVMVVVFLVLAVVLESLHVRPFAQCRWRQP